LRHLICGIDGYIGWSLALHLACKGHEVSGIDNFSRRKAVEEVGSWSATEIRNMSERIKAAKDAYGVDIDFYSIDMLDYDSLAEVLRHSNPDVIFHLGEQPSAPYSMMSRDKAVYTQENNVIGNLNLLFAMKEYARDAALVKLGSMGEYGTPNTEIPEGFFEVEYRGRKDTLPYPKQPGSFYHLSKVHDSGNIMLACKLWGLRATDVMQGVVYGTRTEETNENDELITRFDFDEVFGTAINRFCAEAVAGYPITPYGEGNQTRGFLALVDSVQCLTIISENPPREGEYRVFNQLDETYSIRELAGIVQREASRLGLRTRVANVDNPRVEKAKHYYKVDHDGLKRLGFRPTRPIGEEVGIMLRDLLKYRDRVLRRASAIMPRVSWRDGMHASSFAEGHQRVPNHLAWCDRG
jgi:UDP-sulfoquinovose synthase